MVRPVPSLSRQAVNQIEISEPAARAGVFTAGSARATVYNLARKI